jgi:hydroxymethylpyrimidine pyrophosphatase-like HAD family hydrolase
VDNGVISPKETLQDLPGPPHAYHLIPRAASKAAAVAKHMRTRGFEPHECIAVGDSREDLDVARFVGRFFLVANAIDRDPSIRDALADNVTITDGRNGEGFYEAVVRSLAESR